MALKFLCTLCAHPFSLTTCRLLPTALCILLDRVNVGTPSSLISLAERVPLKMQCGSEPSSYIGTSCGVSHGVFVKDIDDRRNDVCVVLHMW